MILLIESSLLVLLLLSTTVLQTSFALVGPDGNCSIHVFAPFVYAGGERYLGLHVDNRTSIGFSQLAAALLAVKHFNTRNATIVPEIASISDSCTVTLEISRALNAIPYDWVGIRSIVSDGLPSCAIVGPYDDKTASDLSVIAQSNYIPLVATRLYDVNAVSNINYQFTTSVHPDLLSSSRVVADYLLYKQRTNFVAFLYDLAATNMQRREALGIEFDARNVRWMSSTFAWERDVQQSRSVFAAMKRIKDSGFRTIVVAISDPWYSVPLMADAAEELEMNRGGHFFVWFDEYEPLNSGENTNISKLIDGSAWIMPPPVSYVTDGDAFTAAWRGQGRELVDELNELNPVNSSVPGYINASAEFFETVPPEYGSGFMFDAVVAVGIGACNAQDAAEDGAAVSGEDHRDGIREVNFWGATGRVKFGASTFDRTGTRAEESVFWAAVNMLPPPHYYQVTDYLDPDEEDEWMEVTPFIYADGTTSPPKLLRDQPNQNYLSDSLRAFGLTLMGLTMFVAIISITWVFVCRKHKILAASQPEFLYMIGLGSIVQASGVIPSSFDESRGWSEDQLNRACMACPWLLSLGYIMVYSALFTKLWRINKVLQFTRRRIGIRHVAWPMVLLVFTALVILLLWTFLDPFRWNREEISDVTGESIGKCQSDYTFAFVGPLILVMMVPTFLTGVMAYKTKDVDDTYTESWWIFILIVVQVEIILVAVPVIVILFGESADGSFIGFVFLFCAFPMTTLGLIFFPKMVAYRNASRGVESGGSTHKRGERGNSRISGLCTEASNVNHVPSNRSGLGSSSALPDTEEESTNKISTQSTSVPVLFGKSSDEKGDDRYSPSSSSMEILRESEQTHSVGSNEETRTVPDQLVGVEQKSTVFQVSDPFTDEAANIGLSRNHKDSITTTRGFSTE